MNEKNRKLCQRILDKSYVQSATSATNARQAKLTQLLSSRKLPMEPWTESDVRWLLRLLADDDSNNFADNVGVGEREGRVYSRIVLDLHASFAHGVGRSGDLAAMQPKAVGASILHVLARRFALNALHAAKLSADVAASASIVPMATGMTLLLCLCALRRQRPATARYVVWPRVDQKTCFKTIYSAGFEPLVVENVREGDEMRTDVDGVRRAVLERAGGAEHVLCLLSTTSCFAPRAPERIESMARLAKELNVAHVINNAYGVQCERTGADISRAARVGRVDVVVQSTDKNFLVPVGGSVVVSPNPKFVDLIDKTYCGRATICPARDLLITLLSMGEGEWRRLLAARRQLFESFREKMKAVANEFNERLLDTPNNHVSMAMTLSNFVSFKKNDDADDDDDDGNADDDDNDDASTTSLVGGMLYARMVSGHRVVTCKATKIIETYRFNGWGAHCDAYECGGGGYLTVACAIGAKEEEIDTFILRLRKVLSDLLKKKEQQSKRGGKQKQVPPPPTASNTVNHHKDDGWYQ